jgi:hypothetical protein
VRVHFDRKPTGRCADPLSQYPGDDYSVWLYNNPVRNLDTISFDQSIKITDGIKEKAGLVDVTIPKDLPQVKDGSLWYLRVGTSLSTAPQVCFSFLLSGLFFAFAFFGVELSAFMLCLSWAFTWFQGLTIIMQMPSLFNAAGPFTVVRA